MKNSGQSTNHDHNQLLICQSAGLHPNITSHVLISFVRQAVAANHR